MKKSELLRNSLADISELLENQTGINHLEEDYESDNYEDYEAYEMLEPEYMQKRNAALRSGQNSTKAGQTADSAMLRTPHQKVVEQKQLAKVNLEIIQHCMISLFLDLQSTLIKHCR